MDATSLFSVVARMLLGASAAFCAVILFATFASAQRTEYRDKNGNFHGYVQQEGNRSVLRDNSGNPHGYWQQEGNSLVHRDNSGNLLDRQQVK
jgi:hypothetical protein